MKPTRGETRICPVCAGRGFVELRAFPIHPELTEERRAMVKKLRKAGLSLRQVAHALGFKNHNSVIRILAKEGR